MLQVMPIRAYAGYARQSERLFAAGMQLVLQSGSLAQPALAATPSSFDVEQSTILTHSGEKHQAYSQ